MHGYLAPERSELSARGFRDYFKSYCGLCQQLKEDYGRWSRLLVNRDAVVLMLLAEAQYDQEPPCEKIRCGANPFLHTACRAPAAARYAAAVSLVLVSSKLTDTARDARGLGGTLLRWLCLALLWLLSRALKKARATLLELGFDPGQLDALWRDQQVVEASVAPTLEACSRPTAKASALLFAHSAQLAGAQEKAPAFAELGAALGHSIYLMDAWDDLDDDRKRGHFNPLLAGPLPLDDGRQRLVELLHEAREQVARLLSSIAPKHGGALLENLLLGALDRRLDTARSQAIETKKRQRPSPWLRLLTRPTPADCDCCCDCDGDGSVCGEILSCSWCTCEMCNCCDSCVWCGWFGPGSTRTEVIVVDNSGGASPSSQDRPKQEVMMGTSVFAHSNDGYWYEGVVESFYDGLYTIAFSNGAKANLPRAQITVSTDPPPQGFETLVPGSRAKVQAPDKQWLKGRIVSRFGRVFSVELPDGNAAWCDTSKIRVIAKDAETQSPTTCPHCRATVPAGEEKCSFCGTQLRV